MAIYYFDVTMVKSSDGRSAIASSAYRRATSLYSEKEKRDYDYSKKQNVVYREMSAPENSPQWVNELLEFNENSPSKAAETLWNKVEAIEKRKDAQYAREIKVALPKELTNEQSIILLREFIKNQFTDKGMIADWSIHADKGNPHAHIMLTTRELTENGFGKKVREWNLKTYVFQWRAKWAEYANFHLKQNAHDIRIDHRSYKAQGISLLPITNESQAAIEMAARGIPTESRENANYARRENLRRIVSKPEVALEMMTSQSPSFTYEQLGQTLGRYINDKGNFDAREIKNKGVLVENTLANFDKLSGNEPPNKVLTSEAIADIFKKIEQHEAVFGQDELVKALSPYTDNAEIFAKAVIEIKASPELIYLGAGVDGRDRFTTKKMFKLENEIQKNADKLSVQKHITISSKKITSTLKSYQNKTGNELTDEQLNAVKHVVTPSSLSCIVGRAGTGKSFSLGAAKEVWESQKLRVIGVSLSGIASDGLSQDVGIQSQTLASFKYSVENKHLQLNKNDVIVMDEAGMTDNDFIHFVLKETKAAKAKLVLVGDPDQLQPIGAGAVFRALLERVGFAEIQTVYRQKEEWQKQATLDFAAGRTEEGLKAYEEKGCLHVENDQDGALQLLVNDWFKLRMETQKPLKEYLVITHRNEDVSHINHLIRSQRIERQEIVEGYDAATNNGKIKIAKGDRIVFLKNDKILGVKNGRFATVTSVNFTETGRVLKLNVILDSAKKENLTNKKQKEISIDLSQYNDFTHGYAATIHKVQGATYDHNFVYVNHGGLTWDKHLSYVAMSRHRESCHLYTHKENAYQEFNLAKQMGKKRIKDSVLDYPISFAERRGIDTSHLSKLLPRKLAYRLKEFKTQLIHKYENVSRIINPEAYQRKKDKSEKQRHQEMLLKQKSKRNEDARIIADYVDANRDVGIFYQSLKAKLNTFGIDKISYESEAFGRISKTSEYQRFNKSLLERNKIAASFMPNIENYNAAIEHYGLDRQKLNKQACQHESRECVQTYHSNTNNIEFKEKIAFTIMNDIKSHYPSLKEFGINAAEIRQNAENHLKKIFLSNLNEQECKAFSTVERYQALTLEIGKCWSEKISLGSSVIKLREAEKSNNLETKENNTHLISREDLIHFQTLNQECEKLAHEILETPDSHYKSLNFFQIGLSAPHFHYDKMTEAVIKDNESKAQKRWYQLQGRSARYEINARVKNYRKALYLNDTPTRLKLAHEIVQEQKAHYGAIINLDANAYGIRQAINRDAKAYAHQHFYANLNDIEKTSFKLVDEYVKHKNSYGSAWREIFETEKNLNLDKKEVFEKLSIYTNTYKAKRNEYAEKVLLNLPDKKILDYFKVDLTVLYPQLNEHRYSEKVDQYLSEKNVIKRGEIAKNIVEDPKLYAKYIFEKKLSWKDIYRDNRIFIRKKLFSYLTSEEKRFLRLVSHYNALQRQSGKIWSKIYREKENHSQKNKFISFEKIDSAVSLKISKITSKRDALAVQILNAKGVLEFYAAMENKTYDPMDLVLQSEGKALDFCKLQKQAQNHQKRLETINQFKDSYENLEKSLNHYNAASDIITDEEWWLSTHSEIDQTLKPIKKDFVLYREALKQSHISQKTLENLEASFETINLSLKELSKINKGKQEKFFLDEEQMTKILKAQRIAKGTKPITGTLAERYLREHRGIQGDLPESFRYHPSHYNHLAGKNFPALVVLARNEENQIQAVQIISLDPITANKAFGKQSKLSYGSLNHAGVLVNRGSDENPSIIAEGPETAISVAKAMPGHTVYAALGSSNFARMPLNNHVKSVIFAADNDGVDAASVKTLEKAAYTLSLQGIDVKCVMPEAPENKKKYDFNDVLKDNGISSIQTLFESPQMLQKAFDKDKLKHNLMKAVRQIIDDKTPSEKFPEKSIEVSREIRAKILHKDIDEASLRQKSTGSRLIVRPKNDIEPESCENATQEYNHKDYWKKISRESLDIKGTFAEKYFENSGLEVKNYKLIRFHPKVWHRESESYLPALIAKGIKIGKDSAVEKGIQVHYLDKETSKQPDIKNPLRYMGDSSDTVTILQAPADKNDGRWIVALDINSALTIAQSKPERLVALMPSFKEIDKFPISDKGISVTLCADKDFPKEALDKIIDSFCKKDLKVSVLISGKQKTFNQLMREKGKSYISEIIDRAKRVYSPEVMAVADRFKQHDEKMLELKKMPSSYKSIETRKMKLYLDQINKNMELLRKINLQAPELCLRIEKFMQKIKEVIISR